MSDENQAPSEVSKLIDEVMRGERILLFPPGTFVACLLMPMMCVGAVPLMFALTLYVLPLGHIDQPENLAGIWVGSGFSTVVIVFTCVFFGLMILGHSFALRILKYYIKGVCVFSVVLLIVSVTNVVDVPLLFGIVSFIAVSICVWIVGSRPFLAFATFYSLKRDYRKRAKKRSSL